jgi:signal transduction histidine kinase
LFLAAHEAFTNLLKHSGATRARLTMSCGNETFELALSDNGRGFDPIARESGANGLADSGNGLRNMRQRLTDIGGRCDLKSDAANGTTVHFTLPLKKLPKE